MRHKSFHSIHHSNQLVLKDLKLLIMPMFVFCFFLNRPSFAHALHVILNRGVWSTWQIQIQINSRTVKTETCDFQNDSFALSLCVLQKDFIENVDYLKQMV